METFFYVCIQKVEWYQVNMFLFMDSNSGSSKNHPQPNLSDFVTVLKDF